MSCNCNLNMATINNKKQAQKLMLLVKKLSGSEIKIKELEEEVKKLKNEINKMGTKIESPKKLKKEIKII